jgi:Domain of unknown function (DUF4345)
MQLKKAFLIGAFVAVTIIALLYGVSPTWFAATFLGVTDLNLNFAHILRAIAGLYLALAAFWLYAAFNDKYRDAALLTTILFAGGLAAGQSWQRGVHSICLTWSSSGTTPIATLRN